MNKAAALLSRLPASVQKLVHTATQPVHSMPAITSGITALDAHVNNQIALGNLVEWGLPLGQWGRVLPLLFLRHQRLITIWVNAHANLRVYPASWQAFGVDLSHMYFVHCLDPLSLKPLYLARHCDCLVLDVPKPLNPGTLAFLANQARTHKQLLFVISNSLLTAAQGNPFALARFNGWYNHTQKEFVCETIKGMACHVLQIPRERVYGF